ncbi:MAG: hypothetical protein ABL986_07505 [Vicinamibacterales bacterium]
MSIPTRDRACQCHIGRHLAGDGLRLHANSGSQREVGEYGLQGKPHPGHKRDRRVDAGRRSKKGEATSPEQPGADTIPREAA